MTSKKFKLNRRKALIGMAGVGATSMGAGAGTLAYFSDDETVDSNSIQSGTLGLTVSDGDTINYAITGIVPGATTGDFENADPTLEDQSLDFNLELINEGSIDEEVIVVYIENTTSNANGGNFANYVLIRELDFGGNFIDNNGDPVNNPNYNLTVDGEDHETALSGPVTLAEISDTELRITFTGSGPPLGAGSGGTNLNWSYKIDEEMKNDFQGAELDTTFNFALLQDSSQSYTP